MTIRRDTSDFFSSPQGAAILKHQLLKTYLGAFTGKLGLTSGGHVHLIDGYAGPGRYHDGSPGSPALALETARLLQRSRTIHGAFIESDPDHYRRLLELLEAEELADGWMVKNGLAEDLLPDLVAGCGDGPLLVFLDPYGLTVPFGTLVEIVLNRPRRVLNAPVGTTRLTTEVIMNFSVSAVRRMAGWATKPDLENDQQQKTARTFGARLDDFLGGDWWRDIYERHGGDPDWVPHAFREYCKRLRDASTRKGWHSFPIEVSDTYRGGIAYYLVLFTMSPHGTWSFNDAASLGTEALRRWTDDRSGEMRMESIDDDYLVATIADNIEAALDEIGPFELGMKIGKVYGETLGEAREKHVRKAVKQLHKQGRLRRDPTGMKTLIDYLAMRPAAPADTP